MPNHQNIDNEIQFRFRPAARHILTIGKGLVKDSLSAIIELVKNAYDADASQVTVLIEVVSPTKTQEEISPSFNKVLKKHIPNFNESVINSIWAAKSRNDLFFLLKNQVKNVGIEAQLNLFDEIFNLWVQAREKTTITIGDDGHGMTRDDFKNSWLVPSTTNKLKNPKSKSGKRDVQGQKGIGRYATSVLGDDVDITSIAQRADGTKEATTIVLDWLLFAIDKYEFLDEVPILLDTEIVTNTIGTGTKVKIHSYGDLIVQKAPIMEELSKLYIPNAKSEDDFKISVEWKKNGESDGATIIETSPIEEQYHYQIKGSMEVGHNRLKIKYQYINANINKSEIFFDEKNIPFRGESFGVAEFDFKVFDLDNIENKVLNITKKSVKDITGVAIIRNNFKIRPYGDNNYDWLGLNQRRVNSPTNKLSTNQIVGKITIESEEKSNLEEKASREGLKDSPALISLRDAIFEVLNELENRRVIYRNSIKRQKEKQWASDYISSHKNKITIVERSITLALEDANLSPDLIAKIEKQLQELKNPNEQLYDAISSFEEKVFLYQVQATAAQAAMVVVHEAGGMLSVITSNADVCKKQLKRLSSQQSLIFGDELDSAMAKLNGISDNAKSIDRLMEALSKIAIQKPQKPEFFDITLLINELMSIFHSDLSENKISADYSNLPTQLLFYGIKADFFAIFHNLISNSIYWLKISTASIRYLKISYRQEGDQAIFSVEDNAQGVPKGKELEIFLPGFTTKRNGTGLGLAIAGEAARRNSGILFLDNASNPTIFSIKIPFKNK